MKILLFGGAGQLGYEIERRAHDLNFSLVSPVASEVDITVAKEVSAIAEKVKPTLIINAAAYTAVDKAETDSEPAYSINRDGARNVAMAARHEGARIFHISTDYVFDGNAGHALSETAATNPLSVYGASKLAGEKEVLEVAGANALVIRTSSLYGKRGVNFAETMLRLFSERPEVKVVNDQFMSPTWAGWLAEVLLDLSRIPCDGIVHASCSGVCSWYDFAKRILELSAPRENKVSLLTTTAKEFARPAPRPAYSVLNCDRLAALLERPLMTWEEGLKSYLADVGLGRSDKVSSTGEHLSPGRVS